MHLARWNSVPPPNWQHSVWDGNETQEGGYGYQDEDLMVWMRTAALPSFRKLYRRIDHVDVFRDGLPKGNYTLTVAYSKTHFYVLYFFRVRLNVMKSRVC